MASQCQVDPTIITLRLIHLPKPCDVIIKIVRSNAIKLSKPLFPAHHPIDECLNVVDSIYNSLIINCYKSLMIKLKNKMIWAFLIVILSMAISAGFLYQFIF